MRVTIDLTALLPLRSGVDTYLLELVRALARVDREGRYTIFVNREDRGLLSLPENFAVVGASQRSRAARLAFQQGVLPAAAIAGRADVVHSPSFIMPLLRARSRHLVTIHDLTSFTRPECHLPLRRSRAYRAAVTLSVRRADRIHVPSEFVRGELRRIFGAEAASRTVVIPHGIGERFRPPSADHVEAVRARLGLPRLYVLYVGTLEPRKNLTVLLEAYARLVANGRVNEDLVLVGRLGWEQSELLRAAEHDAIRGRVHVTGWLEDDALPVVYAGACAFVYPSIEEGFGFPPLEAMAAGVPTVSSDTSSLRENLAGAAELVAPTDVGALTAALKRVLGDEKLRGKLRRAGLERAQSFRWDESARSTLRCYAELAARQAGGRREAVAAIRR